MYQRILAPVDGSACSRRGLGEAIGIARLTGGRIRVLQVIEEPYAAMGIDAALAGGMDVVTLVRDAAKATLTAAEDTVRAAGIEVDGQLLDSADGRMCELVVKAAQDWPADLIVIGTHGRRGVSRLLIGSGAEQILRLATVPVLLVRCPEHREAP